MIQPLFTDRFVVRGTSGDGRAGEHELFAEPFGPAGECILPIGGVVLRFDTADPTVLCGLEVPGDIRNEVLGRLIGTERAEFVLGRRPSRTARARELAGLGPDPLSLRSIGQPRATLGWAASLWSLAHDPSLPELARAAAALELALLTSELDDLGLPGVASLRSDNLALAGSLLRPATDDVLSLAESDPRAANGLAALCRDAGLNDPVFGETARLLEDPSPFAAGDRWYAFGHRSSAENIVAKRLALHADLSRELVRQQQLHIVRKEVELRAGGRLVLHPSAERVTSPASWVRVLRAGSLELLALVPVQRIGRTWRAEALIPPRLTVDDIEIDVVAADQLVMPSRLEQVRSAIALGREAVSITRTGAVGAAGDVWMECSAMWASLGDERRAELALRRQTPRSRSKGGSVADRIAFGDATARRDSDRRR